jgi:hypothetical protein
MKKSKLFLLFACCSLLFSCSKNKVMNPAQPMQTGTMPVSGLPQFNESNTPALSWKELPEKLRNAERQNFSTNEPNDARTNATYKYFLGPWGGSGGNAFYIHPSGDYDRIYAMGFRAGIYVDAMIVWYIRPDNTMYYAQVGGSGGTYYVQYLNPGEYLSGITGRSGAYLDMLGFCTNYKCFSYGGQGGSPFYAAVGATDQILGFFGNTGVYFDKISVWVYSRP